MLVISCEHGGNGVPPAYSGLFSALRAALNSHRGWDPGALELGRQMASTLHAPLFASTTTRLLIDLNRSIGHRDLFSEATRGLTRAERLVIVEKFYRPHRDAIEKAISDRIRAGGRVVHVASHSFTPILHGVARQADVAWLYDPRRASEVDFARLWMRHFAARTAAPGLRLRRNYPYQGRGDGLTSLLRKRHDDGTYIGIELEVNQRFAEAGGAAWTDLRTALTDSLASALPLQRR